MQEEYYVVRYSGPFGFIKPWTAVRDGETYSQQFLTPSIVEGLRQKLEVTAVLRHRLAHQGFSRQMEQIQSAGWRKTRKQMSREQSILYRGVMLNPTLYLAFGTEAEALWAAEQHVCLCRNEDVLLPTMVGEMTREAYDQVDGFELRFGREQPGSFMVGYNRFEGDAPMYGTLTITGNPTEVISYEL
ncbi:hypothetical protein SAMN05421823_1157 [Catalinimonas alkaloidigena]|uniref:Uncharacterized protein n=1 Tax=Catalinimonas alkaloidigena TaxID=1075417 RepID=A0A1G9TVJ9_9BACT|nr:hypothetical protein [Catalinimonas alkaloidigena]SDM51759.1 hypothetical protein SAMN05421823_1157 [Catalinimonas alkaloidigena]